MIGDPTEGALVTAAKKAGLDKKEMEESGYERIDELPFDSDTKFMAVLNNISNSEAAIFIKGAPDVVLDMCEKVSINGSKADLTQAQKEKYLLKNNHLAQKGLRVLAIACKKTVGKAAEIEKEMNQGMVFLGFAGILDPPRDPSKSIITNRHKIRILFQGVIITTGPLFTYLLALNKGYTLIESRTAGFLTLALVRLLHVFNVRRKNGLGFDKTIFQNPYLWGAFALTIGLQLFAVYTPFMQTILHTTAISPKMWLIVLGGSLGPIVILQLIAGVRVMIGKPYQE